MDYTFLLVLWSEIIAYLFLLQENVFCLIFFIGSFFIHFIDMSVCM